MEVNVLELRTELKVGDRVVHYRGSEHTLMEIAPDRSFARVQPGLRGAPVAIVCMRDVRPSFMVVGNN